MVDSGGLKQIRLRLSTARALNEAVLSEEWGSDDGDDVGGEGGVWE